MDSNNWTPEDRRAFAYFVKTCNPEAVAKRVAEMEATIARRKEEADFHDFKQKVAAAWREDFPNKPLPVSLKLKPSLLDRFCAWINLSVN